MCNNVLEFANAANQTNNLSTAITLSSVTVNMFKALPSLPQWLAISTAVLSNTLDFSVYARTAVYMWRYPEIIDLMKLDGVTQLPGGHTKFINGLAYGFVALDTVLDIYSNIQQNKSVGYIVGSAAYTAATGVGIIWASGKAGAAIGSVGGPLAALAGGIIGIGVGVLLTWLSNLLKGEIFK